MDRDLKELTARVGYNNNDCSNNETTTKGGMMLVQQFELHALSFCFAGMVLLWATHLFRHHVNLDASGSKEAVDHDGLLLPDAVAPGHCLISQTKPIQNRTCAKQGAGGHE